MIFGTGFAIAAQQSRDSFQIVSPLTQGSRTMSPLPASRIRALLIDDDVWSLRLMRGMLRECFPMLHLDTRSVPSAEAGYHIYLIDNDFSGTLRGSTLAHEIRQVAPDALVIAFSGNLDRLTLLNLLNAGCDGVCDKANIADLPRVMEIIQRYIETLVSSQNGRKKVSAREAISAICSLLREWNTRLDKEEARHAS